MSAHQLTPYLKQLRLSGILDTLDVRNQQAIAEQRSYLEFLTRLAQDEVERRGQKQLALRVRRSGILGAKALEAFDFAFNPSINRQQVLDLATCAFVRERRNVLICGQTGVGKTFAAQALGLEACRQQRAVLFTKAGALLTDLAGGRADGSYRVRLRRYLHPQLLILDDFAMRAYTDQPGLRARLVRNRGPSTTTLLSCLMLRNSAFGSPPRSIPSTARPSRWSAASGRAARRTWSSAAPTATRS